MQTNTPSLTAADITNKILSCKGNFVKVFWKSNPSPAAIHKKNGVVLEKVTNAVVRAGIDFANLTSVKEGIANGERGEVQSLPWGAAWNRLDRRGRPQLHQLGNANGNDRCHEVLGRGI